MNPINRVVAYIYDCLCRFGEVNVGGVGTSNEGQLPPYERRFYEAKKLAERGDVEAQYGLGCMYEAGDGVKKNWAASVHWHRKAAIHGHCRAQHNLADAYKGGFGVKKDYALALFWYIEALEQAPDNAQCRLHLKWLTDDLRCIEELKVEK